MSKLGGKSGAPDFHVGRDAGAVSDLKQTRATEIVIGLACRRETRTTGHHQSGSAPMPLLSDNATKLPRLRPTDDTGLGRPEAATMNQETTEHSRGQPRLVSLKNLYLDPNNFRFVDHTDYREVSDERVFDEDVQRRTTRLVLGRNQDDVSDLVDSILENGWIEMEPNLGPTEGGGALPRH